MRSISIVRNGLTLTLLAVLAVACVHRKAPQPAPTAAKATAAAVQESDPVKAQRALIDGEPALTIGRTLAKMRAACDWQLDHLWFYKDAKGRKSRNSDVDWVRGAFFSGVMANYYATGDYRYFLAGRAISEKNKWLTGPRPRHADDRTIAQTYLEIYLLEGKKDPAQIKSIRDRYDAMMADEKPGRVDWWWCDALYMDPPTLTRLAVATGEKKYLDYMSKMYWDCHAFLFDKQAHLFYRDEKYMAKPDGTQMLEKNGKKMFWSRGNGWVFGGLCRVLDTMPRDYAERPKFEALFKEMAEAIRDAQCPDGLWRASLLDPGNYPLGEASGSGFFTYGLAWGINNGYLDRSQYLPAAIKGFKALMACVNEEGKLCYVQPIGANPQRIKAEDNMEYGTGAFLLAGGQVLRLLAGKPAAHTSIVVKNPLAQARPVETVTVPWKRLAATASGVLPSRIRLLDEDGEEVVTQVIYGQAGPQALIFQTELGPNQAKTFALKLSDDPLRSVPVSKTYGRYVPERLDDFAWENDRIAHRVYGTALQTPGTKDYLVSSGIDVWAKRVRTPVIDKWYASGTYHADHGEGLDNYKVDNSRGAGGIGIWTDGTLYSSENYDKNGWRVLANGPIRTTFELPYNPWDADGRQFSEVKRVSLDAGSNLSLIQSHFTTDRSGPFLVGIGLARTRGEGTLVRDKKNGVVAYWEDPDPKGTGSIATGVVVNPNQVVDFITQEIPKSTQTLVLLKALNANRPVSYYAGAGWSKSGDFADAAAWQAYLTDFSRRLHAPLKVTLR